MKLSIFTLACALIVTMMRDYREQVKTEKQIAAYKLLVNEMQQADDHDTCSDYPQWQEGTYVVKGTVICESGIEWRATRDAWTEKHKPNFDFYLTYSGKWDVATIGYVVWEGWNPKYSVNPEAVK